MEKLPWLLGMPIPSKPSLPFNVLLKIVLPVIGLEPRARELHRRERLSGMFDRTLVVPMQIDPDGNKAEYNDGLLALFIPRAERDKPRTIEVR